MASFRGGLLAALLFWLCSICQLVSGELDHIPEQAFYMQGDISDVHKKAEELAKLW
jgi:F0F1-type ATP synthase beta subunit